MILLIWSSERALDCAQAIEHTFQQPVCVVASLQRGCEQLQAGIYSAVLLDQGIAETEPGQADFLFHHLGTAVPVLVNFGISGIERILRELRAAFNRRIRESLLARQNARISLRNELKDDVTALLLSCGIALDEPSMTEAAAARVRKIEEVANQIRSKLIATDNLDTETAAQA